MRLFVAADLDDVARRGAAWLQRCVRERLGEGADALKWVCPEHLHITLAFLGEVDGPGAARSVSALRVPFQRAPFDAGFGAPDVLPFRGAPRVLSLGVDEGRSRLVRLHADVVERLREAGLSCDERVFRPHLTLARWRAGGRRDRRSVRDALGGEARVEARWRVDHVTLYQSRLATSGPEYRELATTRLIE